MNLINVSCSSFVEPCFDDRVVKILTAGFSQVFPPIWPALRWERDLLVQRDWAEGRENDYWQKGSGGWNMIQMLYNFYNFSTKSNKRTKKNCFADEWNPTRTNKPAEGTNWEQTGTKSSGMIFLFSHHQPCHPLFFSWKVPVNSYFTLLIF